MVGLSLPEYGNLYKKCVHTVWTRTHWFGHAPTGRNGGSLAWVRRPEYVSVTCDAKMPPSTWTPKLHNKTAQPAAKKHPTSHFSPFNCWLSVVL